MGDKTEEASPHKLEEARKKGQIPRSKDLPSAVLMIVGFSVLLSQASTLGEAIKRLGRDMMLSVEPLARTAMTPAIALDLIGRMIFLVLGLCAPILGAVMVVGLLINFLLVGPLFTMEPLKPDIKKLNPLPTVKNWFKVKSLVMLFLNVKILVAGILVQGVPSSLCRDSEQHELGDVGEHGACGNRFKGYYGTSWVLLPGDGRC